MALPTWISSITNATLNMTPSTFSFQDALTLSSFLPSYAYDLNPPFLFQDGCRQPDGTQNCTASCLDENAIFGSLDTLHNCMVYPTVADLYARNNLSNPSLPTFYNIEKSKAGSGLSQDITNTIQKCLLDFCDSLTGCSNSLNAYNAQGDEYRMMSPSYTNSSFYIYNHTQSNYFFDVCNYIPASFNQDIGGIGVYISYWIQTGLTLLNFVLVVWWNWGIYYTCLGALSLSRGYSEAKKIAQRIRNQSRNNHLPSLTGALAEFQKAQCFFMLAINIAALINRNRGGFNPDNLQQLYNTYVLIKSISISGYLPVTFTLFTLHLVDVVSWYLLVLSIVTVLVSMATLFVIGAFSPSQDDLNYLSQQASKDDGPASCGSKNIGVYCYKAYDSTDPASGAYSMLAFCLVVLLLLVAHQSHAFRDPSTGQAKPWLSKISNAFFRKQNSGLRKIQFILALISLGLSSYVTDWSLNRYYYIIVSAPPALSPSEFAIFSSCWTLLFIFYLFLTSGTDFTRTDRPIGRFFNPIIALTVDFLSAVFWFACFVAFVPLSQYSDVRGTVVTSVLLALCICITFLATTVLTIRHVLRTQNDNLEGPLLGKHYWIFQRLKTYRLQRRLHERLSSWERSARKSLSSWTKHPSAVNGYTRSQQTTLPTMKSYTRRAYQDGKAHLSTLDWPLTLISAVLFSLYIIFFSLYMHWFQIFIQDLAWFAYNGVDSKTWSFGQIVAISVWAEPLCEYFHLELRGMTRGFEHRLWGYKLVRIKQSDAEGDVVSDSASSARPSSPSTSLDDQRAAEYVELGIVDSSVKNYPARGGGPWHHQDEGHYSESVDGDLGNKPVSGSRDGSEATEERGSVGEWQIPETVILRSGSFTPF